MEPDKSNLRGHVDQLSEHWEAVQILVSRLAPDGRTETMRVGTGNMYTRLGMVQEFLERDKADLQARVSNRIKNEED